MHHNALQTKLCLNEDYMWLYSKYVENPFRSCLKAAANDQESVRRLERERDKMRERYAKRDMNLTKR